MPEDTTAEPQAGDATITPQPQAGATTPTEPQAGESQNISLEEAKKLRSEAQNLRKRLKDFEKAEQDAKDAQLSEVERAKKQYSDLQAQHETYKLQAQDRIVRSEVQMQARELGIINPGVAAKLINWAELEYDDDGMPTNAKQLLENLVKNEPYLARSAQVQQSQQEAAQQKSAPAIPTGNPARPTASPNSLPPGKAFTLTDVKWSR